jgi:hypothetical protein
MSARTTVKTLSFQERADARPLNRSQPDIPALNSLALRSLVPLFDEKAKLFSRRVTLTKEGFHREGTSPKRTVIALLGLQRLAESAGTQPFDIASIQDAVFKDTSWVRSAGDLGLLTWFTAVCAPERLAVLVRQFDFEKAVATYADGREARTAGLAWFLSGIAHARIACPETGPDLTDVAVEAYHLLQDNQGEQGIYGHAGSAKFPRKAVCKRFGTFVDQMYSIYALSRFAQAFQVDEPLVAATDCANSICELQGERGQWWFLYDSRRCRVVSRYPMLAVQQDGTAPSSLFALQEVTGQDFRNPICNGLSWITRAKELGDDLPVTEEVPIWDSIAPGDWKEKYWGTARGFLGIGNSRREGILQVRYEARPDHFGWLLYAFGRFGLPRAMSAAQTASTH